MLDLAAYADKLAPIVPAAQTAVGPGRCTEPVPNCSKAWGEPVHAAGVPTKHKGTPDCLSHSHGSPRSNFWAWPMTVAASSRGSDA
jgi:hypothetical protein